MVNGETNQAFLEAMDTWVREVALIHGAVQEILDAITMLAVTRINYNMIETCASARREVIRHVQSHYPVGTAKVEERLAA